ncbi:MAG: hypothetical protein ACOCVR_04210 [Myxococcota bacterium]
MRVLWVLAVCLSVAAAAGTARSDELLPEGEPVVVLAFTRAGDVGEGVDSILTDLVLEALLNRHAVKALGPSDILGMLSAEQQQQLLGCEEQACRTELAGALGAGRLVVGSVGRLGSLTVVTVSLIDGARAVVLSRASERFERIEEAPAAIGPMVDRLVGAAPSVAAQVPPPQPTAPPSAPAAKVMTAREYCRLFDEWRTKVMEEDYDAELVSTRRVLLEDLLRTPFERDYDRKRSCIWERSGWLDNGLLRRVVNSGSAEAAQDGRKRFYEWRELVAQTERVQELWERGAQREAQGGSRYTELPFDVEEAPVPQAQQSEELDRYQADYPAASRVIARALAAVAEGNQEAFEALFGPEVEGRSRTSPHYVYSSLRSMHEDGYSMDACPIWVIDHTTLERAASTYARQELLEVCARLIKDDFNSTDDVRLRREGEQWVIDRW